MTTGGIRVLLLEDSAPDALLVTARLEELPATVHHVRSGPEFEAALRGSAFDAILSDYEIPGFSGELALAAARALVPDVPFLFVSGALGEERAIELLKAGATDYILKGGLQRLVPSLRRALDDAEGRRVRQRAEEETRRRVELDQLLVGIVSHDLRNPVAAIQIAARLLQLQDLPAAAARNVARILSASGRADRLIRNVLDLTESRLGGGLRVRPGPMDLVEVAQQVVDELRTTFIERTIELEMPEKLPGTWDPDRLAQVISNLVANAVQHGDGSPIRVRLVDGPGQVTLEVHNQGEPIPADSIPRIFEALQRAEGSGGPGVGLGLYIVDQIARAHGGTVEVDSAEGRGTTFRVRLPRPAAELASSERRA
jgi:signal transduction histidine kinase